MPLRLVHNSVRLITSFGITLIFVMTANRVYSQPNELIHQQVGEIQKGLLDQINGVMLHCPQALSEFYIKRNFELAWSNHNLKEFRKILLEAEAHGLDPYHYHYGTILKLSNGLGTMEPSDLDLILTDALIRYTHHMLNGQTTMDTVISCNEVVLDGNQTSVFLASAVRAENLNDAFARLIPPTAEYQELKTRLARYREIEAKGGWKTIPEGSTLNVGMLDWDRVPLIVDRLKKTGDVDEEFMRSPEYTEQLSEAIMTFQKSNGIKPVGHVGQQTLAALNVPVKEKIAELLIELEAYRKNFKHQE